MIVGAGYAGAVLAERIASQLGQKVIVVDSRNHIAGNAFDFYDDNHILCHRYGPHIFHTNNRKVWDYLSNFTQWRRYEHKVLAVIGEKKVPVPFNLNSIHLAFPTKQADKYEKLLIDTFGEGLKIPILKLRETPDNDLKTLADYIYENIFYGYTLKQWELKPEELDSSVTARIPVFISRDDRYFQDEYQGLPLHGYTRMFEAMLSHRNIHVLLNADFADVVNDVRFDKLIYTGNIDRYFGYIHGELPYRSLEFEFRHEKYSCFQETAQVNYPNSEAYTRITEFRHLTGQEHHGTTIAYEYSKKHVKELTEPYYPIPRNENEERYGLYLKEAEKLKDTVSFIGRLANYKYYNMDQIVGVALQFFRTEICKEG